MTSFDPTKPAVLHDRVSQSVITWTGEFADSYLYAHIDNYDGSVSWNGKVLDGWGNVLGG